MPPPTLPRLTVIPHAAQPVVAWRNGGGTTRQVAAEPFGARAGDAFAWRVSIADVGRDGPFSTFPGVDRTLWLLRGNGMVLDIEGRELRLDRVHGKLEFPGEPRVTARLLDGPTQDLNLMVDRARVVATAELVTLAANDTLARRVQPRGQHLLLVLAGCIRSRAPGHAVIAAAGDALLLDAATTPCPWQLDARAATTALITEFVSDTDTG